MRENLDKVVAEKNSLK